MNCNGKVFFYRLQRKSAIPVNPKCGMRAWNSDKTTWSDLNEKYINFHYSIYILHLLVYFLLYSTVSKPLAN
jgi:hypothetical protein